MEQISRAMEKKGMKNMDMNQVLENKKLVIVIIAALGITGVLYYFCFWKNDEIEVVDVDVGIVNEANTTKVEKIDADKLVVVHVSGAVNNPGIVRLTEGERIADAIEKAGGATDEADLGKLNLAYVLEDGVKLRIPKIGEKVEEGEYVSEGSGEVIEEGATEEKKESDASAGTSSAAATTSKASTASNTKKATVVNINKANQEELTTLPGIGAATAQKIIDYRKENGNFKAIEDIKKVSGIGDSKFNQIKNLIKVK